MLQTSSSRSSLRQVAYKLKVLQYILTGSGDRQPHRQVPSNLKISIPFPSNACANHHVHQCVEQLAKDVLRQDD